MKREEFSVAVRVAIARRSGGTCERHLWRTKQRCTKPAKEFDHLKPFGLGGESTAINGAHLCAACHLEKTKEDTPRMRKADAQFKALHKIKPKGVAKVPQRPPVVVVKKSKLLPDRPLPPRKRGLYE